MFGISSWSLVASYVGNGRTRAQCSQRWFRGIDPTISRVKWTDQEIEKLVRLVEKYGTNQWVKVANEMGDRCDVQCRYKYSQIQRNREKERKNPAPPKLPSIRDIMKTDIESVNADELLRLADSC